MTKALHKPIYIGTINKSGAMVGGVNTVNSVNIVDIVDFNAMRYKKQYSDYIIGESLVAYQIGYVADRCPRRQFQTLISQIMPMN